MSVELKIKEKSLALEARIIRREEQKAKKSARWHRARQEEEKAKEFEGTRKTLYEHRIDVVRFECRATNLARAYIKGTPYRNVERTTRASALMQGFMVKRVQRLVNKYHNTAITPSQIHMWFNIV